LRSRHGRRAGRRGLTGSPPEVSDAFVWRQVVGVPAWSAQRLDPGGARPGALHGLSTAWRFLHGGPRAVSLSERDWRCFLAWFNSRIFAGDKSWVAGVELATASEPQRASLGSGGVALRASIPATPEL